MYQLVRRMKEGLSVKRVSCLLSVFVATSISLYAQTGGTGTWRVEGIGSPPWEVALKVDGTKLTGVANSCASFPGTFEIFDGRVEQNVVTFKCRSGDLRRTVTLTARIKGDEAAFSWTLQSLDRANPRSADPLFGVSAPPQFTARRVPDGQLAQLAASVRGSAFSGAANIVDKDVRVDGRLFLPEKVSRVRAVIVVIRYGLGFAVEQDPEWEKLAEQTESALLFAQFGSTGPGLLRSTNRTASEWAPSALLLLLQRLARDSRHRELADAPVVLWGQSGAGWFAINFAQSYPKRTIAFVHYRADYGGDLTTLSRIPALMMAGGKDTQIPAAQIQTLWKSGRSIGAPWTFALDVDAGHGDEEPSYPFLKKADALMMPWIAAVIRQRVSPDGKTLRQVTPATAWMGNIHTGEVAPFGKFSGSPADASWLPNEASAKGWRALIGLEK